MTKLNPDWLSGVISEVTPLPQPLSVLKTEFLCEHRPVHAAFKQVCDVFVSNGIVGLGWCVLPESREALPGADFSGHKVTALGNY